MIAHLALSLLLFEALELVLLLGPLFAPFVDVFLQLLVQVRPLLVLTLNTQEKYEFGDKQYSNLFTPIKVIVTLINSGSPSPLQY